MSALRDKIFTSAHQQGLVLTANKRLARHLQADYDQRMVALGHQVWATPQILSFEGWLNSVVQKLGADGQLLQGRAQKRLWEQIIEEDTQGSIKELLQIPATAEMALQAAQLFDEYDLSLKDQPLTADQQAFQRWQQTYRRQCQKEGWHDRGWLLRQTEAALRDGELATPQQLILVGFDQLPPFLIRLLDRVRDSGGAAFNLQVRKTNTEQPRQYGCDDAEQEVVLAARWARARLEEKSAGVGIVVPDLKQRRALIERIFRAQLSPSDSLIADHREGDFSLSLGAPLIEQGPILAALDLLAIGPRLRLEQCSRLLRSPYLRKAAAEADQRALFETWLRSFRQPTFGRKRLMQLARQDDRAPHFAEILAATELRPQPEQLLPGDWAGSFDQLLYQVGWPGDGTLSSREYQVVMAWREKLLPGLAALDQLARPLTRVQALNQLRRMATETEFQVEAPTGPLQVVGLLEAAGLEFEHLWVMGMNEEGFPAPARPNPFLPYPLQVQARMPHADAERELHFSRAVFARLAAASSQTIFSYTRRAGECTLRPSPLIAHLPAAAPDFAPVSDPASLMRKEADQLEKVDDFCAPILGGKPMRGGTALLRDQALCPFRAFAHHRLQARAPEEPDPGIDALARGGLLHRALELFWGVVRSHAQLCRLDETALRAQIATVVAQSLEEFYSLRPAPHDELLQLEVQRLNKLLEEWLTEHEKTRPAFSLVDREQEQCVQIGPLQIRTVVDRIDQLADGSRVIIDYKTGLVKADLLIGERLLEPQLPIYAVTDTEQPADGVAFAQIRAGGCRLLGVTRDADLLPRVAAIDKNKKAAELGISDWQELLAHWRCQLEDLAAAFCAGEAQVDPVSEAQACRYCDLKPLCRIAEAERGVA